MKVLKDTIEIALVMAVYTWILAINAVLLINFLEFLGVLK